MLKLHFNPGSCSLASHAALEEAGLPYETELVDLTKNVQYSDEYRKKNPWARVPALEIEEKLLTEKLAILSSIDGLVGTDEGRVGPEGVGRCRFLSSSMQHITNHHNIRLD